MTDHPRQDWLDEYHDGNCPICEEPFDVYHEFYPESEVIIKATEQDEGQICVRATCKTASPDPLLELYKHHD